MHGPYIHNAPLRHAVTDSMLNKCVALFACWSKRFCKALLFRTVCNNFPNIGLLSNAYMKVERRAVNQRAAEPGCWRGWSAYRGW